MEGHTRLFCVSGHVKIMMELGKGFYWTVLAVYLERPPPMSWPSCIKGQFDMWAIHGRQKDDQTYPVATDLLPLNLLAGDRELSSQTLECTLVELCEGLVDLGLVVLFHLCDLSDSIRGVGERDGLGSLQADVAIFVVVDVNVDGTGDGGARGSEEVVCAPATVPANLGQSGVPDRTKRMEGTRSCWGCTCC